MIITNLQFNPHERMRRPIIFSGQNAPPKVDDSILLFAPGSGSLDNFTTTFTPTKPFALVYVVSGYADKNNPNYPIGVKVNGEQSQFVNYYGNRYWDYMSLGIYFVEMNPDVPNTIDINLESNGKAGNGKILIQQFTSLSFDQIIATNGNWAHSSRYGFSIPEEVELGDRLSAFMCSDYSEVHPIDFFFAESSGSIVKDYFTDYSIQSFGLTPIPYAIACGVKVHDDPENKSWAGFGSTSKETVICGVWTRGAVI